MKRIESKEEADLAKRIKQTKDVSERNRLCVLLAWRNKKEVSEIAQVLQLSEDTVDRYIREYTQAMSICKNLSH